MAITTPIDVALQPYRAGTKQGYSFRPRLRGKITYDQTIASLSEKSGVNPSKVRGVLDSLNEVIIEEAVVEQKVVKLGFGDIRLTATGSINDLSEDINAKCEVALSYQPCGAIADMLKAAELVNQTQGVPLHIDSVFESGHPNDGNCLFTANADVSITTSCGRIDTTRDDEGVWLVNAAGEKVATAVVATSNSSYSIVRFATLPEPGKYTLVYACRDGGDPDEITLTFKTRNVTVVAAA